MALTYTKSRWFNGDNLTVYFPGATATETRGGAVNAMGEHIAEVFITLADLPLLSGDSNGLLLADNVRIPSGAFIKKVEVFVTKEPTEASGTDANLNVGIVNATTMAITDADGILAAADAFHAGTDLGTTVEYVKGTTEAGALVGTQLAATSLLCAAYDTDPWTGGVIRLRVFWTPVLAADD